MKADKINHMKPTLLGLWIFVTVCILCGAAQLRVADAADKTPAKKTKIKEASVPLEVEISNYHRRLECGTVRFTQHKAVNMGGGSFTFADSGTLSFKKPNFFYFELRAKADKAEGEAPKILIVSDGTKIRASIGLGGKDGITAEGDAPKTLEELVASDFVKVIQALESPKFKFRERPTELLRFLQLFGNKLPHEVRENTTGLIATKSAELGASKGKLWALGGDDDQGRWMNIYEPGDKPILRLIKYYPAKAKETQYIIAMDEWSFLSPADDTFKVMPPTSFRKVEGIAEMIGAIKESMAR